jgi:hypothetical protein
VDSLAGDGLFTSESSLDYSFPGLGHDNLAQRGRNQIDGHAAIGQQFLRPLDGLGRAVFRGGNGRCASIRPGGRGIRSYSGIQGEVHAISVNVEFGFCFGFEEMILARTATAWILNLEYKCYLCFVF